MNLNSIRAFFEKGNRTKWFVFTLFCLILFIKTLIFHFSVGLEVKHLVSGHVIACFVFWLGKIAPILFLGSFVFMAKRQWWTIVINVIVDLWAIANLFYSKANNMFLSVDVVLMADNLDGFWSSLYSYIGWDIYSFVLLTILYVIILTMTKSFHTKNRKVNFFVVILVISLLIDCGINSYHHTKLVHAGNFEKSNKEMLKYFYPFGGVHYFVAHYNVENTWAGYDYWAIYCLRNHSIISFLPDTIIYYFLSPDHEIIELDGCDIMKVNLFIHNVVEQPSNPKTNIIFILFESLESWPVYDVIDYCYLPNIQSLTQKRNVLFCDKLKIQTKYGNSADGQMINVTGLLPISNGATCKLYGCTKFPNYAHFFNNSAIINPCTGAWQQSTITHSYQYDKLIEPKSYMESWNDENSFDTLIRYSTSTESPFCVLEITVDSHAPFIKGSKEPAHKIEGMPSIMSDYLNSLYHTDSCIGILLDTILNSHLAENTTIVITGDHTIFRNEIAFSDLTEYAQNSGIDFKAGHTFTPLIIYSPEIEGNIHVTDTCYQMDVFPTILHLIGAEDYYWHGFGVNLLDSVARHNRPITEQEAYRLSDLMIRSDYFRNYYKPTLN